MDKEDMQQTDHDLLTALRAEMQAFMSEMRNNFSTITSTSADHELRLRGVERQATEAKASVKTMQVLFSILVGLASIVGGISVWLTWIGGHR